MLVKMAEHARQCSSDTIYFLDGLMDEIWGSDSFNSLEREWRRRTMGRIRRTAAIEEVCKVEGPVKLIWALHIGRRED